MTGVARLGDRTVGTCSIHGANIGGTIVTASGDNMVNGKPTARLGDRVLADCGHVSLIVTSSTNVKANGRGVARLGDLVGAGEYTATIITSSTNTDANN